MEVFFETNDTLKDNREYLLSDLEDLLSHLSPSRISFILSKFAGQLYLVKWFAVPDNHKRNYSVKLKKNEDKYWIESFYPISPFIHSFFLEIIQLKKSNPDKISDYIRKTQSTIRKKVYKEKHRELAPLIFDLRAIRSVFFTDLMSNIKLEIELVEKVPYLKTEFFSDLLHSSTGIYKYQKKHLRLSKVEERVKKLLNEGSKIDINSNKSLILDVLNNNDLFQKQCLQSSEIILTCLKTQFIDVLKRIDSIHYQGDFPNDFPEIFWEMNQLKSIFIRGSNFCQLPSQFEIFQKLSYLNIQNAEISNISPQLGKLKNLRSLWLNENKLNQFPLELSNLDLLDELCLDNNPIKEIPNFIFGLKKIRWIRITDCRLQSIHPFIGNLDNLEYISLRRNQIEEIPVELLKNKSLNQLDIAYNPLNLDKLKQFKSLRDKINPDLRIDIFDDNHFKIDIE